MRRAILHIGTPRTGTTSLQHILVRHRAALAARGVLYPELTPRSAAQPHLSHQYLGEALDGRRPAAEREELLRALEAQLAASQADVVILSYEGLCQIPAFRAAPRRLGRLLARQGFAPEILMTLKPQAELINSTYTWRSQFLRETRRFEPFLRAQLASPWLRYDRMLRPWMAMAGGRARAVGLRDPRDAAPLLQRVVAELGLADRLRGLFQPEDGALTENRSPGPVAVEVSRRLRAQGAHLLLRGRVREATRRIEQLAREAGLDAAPFHGLRPELQTRVEAHFAAANAALARTLWGQDWGARMAAAPPRPVNDLGEGPAPQAVTELQARIAEEFALVPRGGAGLALRDGLAALAERGGWWLRRLPV